MRTHDDFDGGDSLEVLFPYEQSSLEDLVRPLSFVADHVYPIWNNFTPAVLKASLLGPTTKHARDLGIIEVHGDFHAMYERVSYIDLDNDNAVRVWPGETIVPARGFEIFEATENAPCLPLWSVPSLLGPNPNRLSGLLAVDGRLNIMFCDWQNAQGQFRPGVVSMWHTKSEHRSGWWITARAPGDTVVYPAGTRVLQSVEEM